MRRDRFLTLMLERAEAIRLDVLIILALIVAAAAVFGLELVRSRS